MKTDFLPLAFFFMAAAGYAAAAESSAPPTDSNKPTVTKEKKMETATIAGGCFWCLEATFERVKGVENVVSGYTAGKTKNPTYEQVCSGLTGHTEAVQITFNPAEVTFESLLRLFFELHDPTTLNAQFPDTGTQYRSGIYCHDDKQKETAEKLKKELDSSGKFKKPIVTEIQKLDVFYPAEDSHQDYFESHYEKGTGNWGYLCRIVAPKVEKLKKLGVELKPVSKSGDSR